MLNNGWGRKDSFHGKGNRQGQGRQRGRFFRHFPILLPGEQGHLSDLLIGQRAKVLALHSANPALKRHLLDMGITPGVEILVKKRAPLGDPIDIELRGYELCIRKVDMENIDIEVLG